MIAKAAIIIGLAVSMLTACQPLPPTAPNPPVQQAEAEPEAAATTPEPQDTMKALPPSDVRAMTCATLMGVGDDDKAYAATFLLGYRAALMHTHVIDTKKIEAVEEAALQQCATTPTAIASKVFAIALMKVERASEPTMQFRRRPRPPTAASAPGLTPPTTDQSAPEAAPDEPAKQ
jgi:hypothetical protein